MANKLKYTPCCYIVLGTVKGPQGQHQVCCSMALSCKNMQTKQNIQPEVLETKF